MSKPRGQRVPHRSLQRFLTPGHQSDLVVFYFRHGGWDMNTKNTPKRSRITDQRFSQPRDFIAATGYGNTRFHLDTKSVSLHVSAELDSNRKMSTERKD
jgi:hypothetical protein